MLGEPPSGSRLAIAAAPLYCTSGACRRIAPVRDRRVHWKRSAAAIGDQTVHSPEGRSNVIKQARRLESEYYGELGLRGGLQLG